MNWRKSMLRSTFSLAALCAIGLLNSPADAMIVPSEATTTAPAGNPYWANHTDSGSLNYVYLGDGWALTARHVGPSSITSSLTFGSETFNIIQNYVVHNPSSVTNKNGVSISLTAETDLRLVRLSGNPSLTEICGSRDSCAISTTSPPAPVAQPRPQVTLIGHGPSRTTALPAGNGYNVTLNDVKRWGTNNLEDPASFTGSQGPFVTSRLLSTTTGVMSLKTSDMITRDVISFISNYNHAPPPTDPNTFLNPQYTEAQVFSGDSGSSVFYRDPGNNQWYLTGIVNAAFTFDGQAANTVLHGNLTTFADLSYYRENILRSMETLRADVNLDGQLTGSTAGGVATGDISAFVAGWGYNNGTGMGTVTSWMNGDLSRDGKTDYADFVIMRNALEASGLGGGSQLQSLLGVAGGGGVPEPTSLILAALGAAALACRRRRR